MPPYPDPFYDARQEITRLTEEIIRKVAAAGRAVIVGRGAGFILQNPSVFRVFLEAPEKICVKTLQKRFGFDEAQALRQKHRTDANRAAYIKQLYHADWRDPAHYDLVLNTARLGYELSAQLICQAVSATA
jgi:cytidylate kinase